MTKFKHGIIAKALKTSAQAGKVVSQTYKQITDGNYPLMQKHHLQRWERTASSSREAAKKSHQLNKEKPHRQSRAETKGWEQPRNSGIS